MWNYYCHFDSILPSFKRFFPIILWFFVFLSVQLNRFSKNSDFLVHRLTASPYMKLTRINKNITITAITNHDYNNSININKSDKNYKNRNKRRKTTKQQRNNIEPSLHLVVTFVTRHCHRCEIAFVQLFLYILYANRSLLLTERYLHSITSTTLTL